MRIDSVTFFTASLAGIRDNQSAMARLNEQIATGQNYLAPKDDPLATQKVLDLGNRLAARTQYAANQTKAGLALEYESTVLNEVESALKKARALIVGTSPAFDAQARDVQAQQLRGVFNHLLGLANTQDPSGNYIFAGDKTTTQPFANAGGGIPPAGVVTSYVGTASTRDVEVDAGRRLQVSDNLDTVFQAGGGPGVDLLQTLDEAIVRLPLDGALPGAINDQATLDGYIQTLDDAINALAGIQYRIAGAQTELADLSVTTQSLLTLESNALGDLQQLDQATAIMQLKTRQTSLEAAERAYAMTSSLSLFSFLS
jgi:flagellar hook-associated protein 3 FlgL